MFNSNITAGGGTSTPFRSASKRKRETPAHGITTNINTNTKTTTPITSLNESPSLFSPPLTSSVSASASLLRSNIKRNNVNDTSFINTTNVPNTNNSNIFSSRKKVNYKVSSNKTTSNIHNKLIDIYEAEYEQQYGKIIDSKLYPEGGLIVLRERGIFICLSILKNNDTKYLINTNDLSGQHSNLKLFELQNSNNNCQTRYLLAAYSSFNDNKRSTGLLLIIFNEDTSKYTLAESNVELIHDDEVICSIAQYDKNHFLLGSNRNELYLTKCNDDGGVTIHQLSSHNLLLDMVQTGVQWLGLSNPFSFRERNTAISHINILTKHQIVLSIGSNITTAWYNVQNVGDEVILWKINLKSSIKDDINSIAQNQKVLDDEKNETILDVIVGPAHEDDTTAFLYVLSRIKVSQPAPKGNKRIEVVKLWLHVIEVNISRDVNVANARVCSRVCICDDINESAMTFSFLAKLYIVPSTGHLQILWLTPQNINTVCIDSNFLPDIANPHHIPDQMACNKGVGIRSEDTGIRSSKFQSSVLLKNEQRISVLDQDGVLALTSATALILTRDTELRAADNGMANMAKVDAIKTITAYTKGHNDMKSSLDSLHRVDKDAIENIIYEINSIIAEDKPSGQHWDYQSSEKFDKERATYQLSHYFVDEKVKAHTRLIDLLEASKFPIPVHVLETHQLLLGCKGVSDYMQQAYASDKTSSDAESMIDKHCLDMNKRVLMIHSKAIKIAMLARNEVQDWKLMGLSSADVFYSNVNNWLDTRNDGLNAFSEALKKNKSIHAAFGVAYLMYSAIHYAGEGPGNSMSGIELLSSEVARNSIIDVFDVIREFVIKNDNNDAIKHLFNKINEGKRLRELCSLLLKSYAVEAEAQGNSKDGSQSNESFKQSYQNAKQRCIDVFILLKAPSHAFKLSRDYYYFQGLFEAYQSDESLYYELSEVVKSNFDVRGTENDPLGTYCMKWFEQKKQIPAILEFGEVVESAEEAKRKKEEEAKRKKEEEDEDEDASSSQPMIRLSASPSQLQLFLSTRPHIAWLHQIKKGSYHSASRSLYQSAGDNPSCKKVLLSLAKLSNRLHSPLDEMLLKNINKDLFVLNIQELIGEPFETNEFKLFQKLLHKAGDDGLRLSLLQKTVPTSNGDRSHRSEISETLLLALRLLYKMNLNENDKFENTLKVWSTALNIDRSYWFELGLDNFVDVTAIIASQMKETIFAKLVSLFDEIKKGIIADEFQEGHLNGMESMLIRIENAPMIIDLAVKKAKLNDASVNNERLLTLIKICYQICYQNAY